MKRWAIVALLLVACGKKEQAATKSEPAASASAVTSASSGASGAGGAAGAAKAGPVEVSGSYSAKQGTVRMPEDAPPFIHPESKDGIGDGKLSMTLPGGDGAVVGKATGALGTQAFTGFLEGDRLVGTLAPTTGEPEFWATLEAKREGSKLTGVLRASNGDGRIVREATFTLEPSK